jgi:hypothetical protein
MNATKTNAMKLFMLASVLFGLMSMGAVSAQTTAMTTTNTIIVNNKLSLSADDVANVLVSVPAGTNTVFNYTPTTGGAGVSLTIASSNSLPLAANVLITDQYNNATLTASPPTNGTMVLTPLTLLDVSSDLAATDVTYYLTVGYTCGTTVAPYTYNSVTGWTLLTGATYNTANPCSITFPIPADPVVGVFTETTPTPTSPTVPPSTSAGSPATASAPTTFLPTVTPFITGNQTGYLIANLSQSGSESVSINGTSFSVVENFITPTSAGVTVDGQPFTLSQGAPVRFNSTNSTFFYVELTGISYLPVLQTVTLELYGQPVTAAAQNATAANTTATTPTPSSALPVPTTTVAPVNATSAANATAVQPSAPSSSALPAIAAMGLTIAAAIAIGISYSRRTSRTRGRKR